MPDHVRRRRKATRVETPPPLLVNNILPEGFGFINEALDKKKLANLVDRLYKQYGAQETAHALDRIMQLGFRFSTRSGTTVSIADIAVPPTKHDRIHAAEEEVEQIEQQYRRGLLTAEERYRGCAVWNQDQRAGPETCG